VERARRAERPLERGSADDLRDRFRAQGFEGRGKVANDVDRCGRLEEIGGADLNRARAGEEEPEAKAPQPANLVDYIYEQPPEQMFSTLLPRLIETQIFRALLESVASEHGARMTAMDSASKNASELIDTLTLNMNRIRQAAITNEIIEIVSGAAAL